MSRLLRLALLAGLLVPLAAQAQAPRVQAALAHAQDAAVALDLGAAEFVVTDATRNARTGADYVYLRQTIDGVEVVGAEATVAVTPAGRVEHAAGLDRIRSRSSVPVAALQLDRLTPADAADIVARANGLGGGSFVAIEQAKGPSQATRLTDGGVAAEPVPTRLVWHAAEDRAPMLAWEVMLEERSGDHVWLAYVDAQTGDVLDQIDLVVHDAWGHAEAARLEAAPSAPAASFAPFTDASLASGYRVYGMPVEAPIYAATLPPADGRTLEVDPDNATASPLGWHNTGATSYTITRGNNVHAYTDVDANNSPDPGSSPDGGGALTFDFPLDLSQAPSAYRPASVANLFYWNNVIHDVMYQYGFDEASGNFQVNNFGNGGAGNDDVRAEAQDGGGTNNANFFTPADGSRPRMQMYIGTSPNPDVDGSFDNGVVVHEYGHGISNRLTGGPSQSGCLGNSEQMGEGWSDYYALMFTMEPGDTAAEARGIGNYLFGYGANGGGIRPSPYSTNFAVNSYTYGDTRSGLSVPHGIGFVWATILWEATWDMIAAHGFDADIYNAGGTAGNQIMMQLVTEGLKLQPCSPGFVSGRDAILAADAALYGGAHAATLQAAFARRGLGFSANQGSTNTNGDNSEAFDLWPTGGNTPPTAAFSVACTGLGCQFTDGSSDSDGTIASRAWTFGDGGTSSATDPSHTYGAAGTYTATLTVTDNDGATDSASQSVTVSSGGNPITLSATLSGGRRPKVNLSWSPADGGKVFVYRNGSQIARTKDDGSHSDRNGGTGDVYQVCETDSGDCSNLATVGAASVAASFGEAIDTEVRVAPNPMAGSARVSFGLEEAAEVELVVFNTIGQQVAVLASGRFEQGNHVVPFDAGALPSGVYIYRLTNGVDVQSGRLVIVR